MTAMQIAAQWREIETLWLEHGEVEHARLCGALAQYWSRPLWQRLVCPFDCYALHQELILSTRRLLNKDRVVKQ